MKNKLKYLLFLFLICCTFSAIKTDGFVYAEGVPSCVKIIYSHANIYLNLDDIENKDNIILVADYGQTFQTLENQIFEGCGLDFYKVKIDENSSGYVLVSHTLSTEIESPKRDLDYNAELKKDAQTFNKENDNYTKGIILEKGLKIKILSGYSKDEDYTLIQYQNENKDIITTYVKTDVLKVSKISRTTIGAIIIIVTTVSLVLVVFGISNRKKKLKKKLKKN